MFNYIIAALIGAMSAILANRNIAVYNDGFRPVYTEYLNGRMDRKALAATSFAVSIGLIIGFAFTNSIAMGIVIIHTYLLMGDIIGTWFPDNKKGLILSAVVGALWGVLVVAFMSSIQAFFSALPVNFLTQLAGVADYVVTTFAVFPALVVGYQCGVKKGLITAAITLATYLLISRFGVFQVGDFTLALNGEGMAMLAGTITMIVFAVKNKTDAAETGLTNIFSTNIDAIKKHWILFCITGGLLACAASQCFLTTDVISGPLAMQGSFGQAALVALVRAIGYVPLVYTTAIVTGVFSPAGSYFSVAAGLFVAAMGLSAPMGALTAFISGALVMGLEVLLLGVIGGLLDKFPALRELGDYIRDAMSKILELALLVGGFTSSFAIMNEVGMGALGPMTVMIVWMLNKTAKKPVLMPLAVGPVVAIALGIIANVIMVLGLGVAA
ncbi:YhfT family protein [uncultured Faecalibaculum sp.]|uniref:YhfT family protein n=1 Tax=uncultured Faecalibaculum sp. TaxID=1729681 RepID=UPI0025FAE4DB|nr:YhfT family protein [uncultured Faecalibaculum sp.]